MLDERISERVDRLVKVRFRERDKQLPLDIRRITNEAAAAGSYGSGNTLTRTHNLFVREIEIRSVIIWESLVRVHGTLGSELTETLSADFKDAFGRYLGDSGAELSQMLEPILANMRRPSTVDLSLNDAISHAKEKHNLEADIYVDSLRQRAAINAESPERKSEYHFYGSVGAVQTGASACANVVQNLEASEMEALLSALELAKSAIEQSTELLAAQKTDLIAMTTDSIDELQSDNPNNTKLRTMLAAIAGSIQTIASAPQAYNNLKFALLPFGITLP